MVANRKVQSGLSRAAGEAAFLCAEGATEISLGLARRAEIG